MSAGEEAVRGFPAFPAGKRLTKKGRSWWSTAWVEAMEGSALDIGRLARGRTYARQGRVGSIAVSPGRIVAAVTGSRADPYGVQVTVRTLTDEEWDRFLDEVAAKAGHIAALLDHDMPHDLVESAEDADVPLLPTFGDLDPDCSCPDWGHPCKHAAALCYQASWLLDEDPFVLLLMRGRGERELLAELRRRNEALAAVTPSVPAEPVVARGVPAADLWSAEPQALPADPAAPPEVALEDAPWLHVPAPAGVDPSRLTAAAASAAARAAALLAEPSWSPDADDDGVAATTPFAALLRNGPV